MKNKLKFFITFILLIIAFSFVNAQTPSINITLMNQNPDPVSPGNYVELRFKIFNNKADTIAENFQIMIEPKYPFSLDSNEDQVKNLGSLLGYGNSQNVQIVKFKVRVDEKAVEGLNPITIKYKHGRLDWFSQEFNVDVQAVDANLAIVSVKTEPEKIKPGEEAVVNVKLKNMAMTALKDITLKLDLTMSSFLKSTSLSAADSINAFNAMPFAPLGSSTEQKIYTLSANEEHTFSYRLIAYPDATSKIYKVPIILSYYDNKGNQYTKSDVIGLVVGTKPDMSVIIDETDLYVGKKTGLVTIKIINKGFTDIKFLDVKAKDTENLQILSSKEVYIGNVDSDDYETAEFKVYTNGNLDTKTEKTIKFPVVVEYRDANNNFYSEEYELDLPILSQSKLNEQKSSGSFNLILIAFVLIVGIFLYRKFAKKKNKKE
ncbi:MAG: hypothetical protein QW757_00500 [Candidatus Woesearchaeota archaeon]